MGIKDRKERKKKELKRLILDAGKKLFIEEGFDKVTIRRLAEKIEYSPGTIYLYFKDKNELLYELHKEGFDDLYKRQRAVLNVKDPLKRMRKHAQVYLLFAMENPEYYDLMFIMRSPIKFIQNKHTWEIGMRSYELFRKDVKACIDAGLITETNPDIAAFSLWSLMHGIVSLIIRERCIMFSETEIPAVVKGVENFMLKKITGAE